MKYATIFLMLGALLYGTTARAETTCAVCPDGCVPIQSVDRFIPAPSPQNIRACPAGCVALQTVLRIKDPDPCAYLKEKKTDAEKSAPEHQPTPVKDVFKVEQADDVPEGFPPPKEFTIAEPLPYPPQPEKAVPPDAEADESDDVPSATDFTRGRIMFGKTGLDRKPGEVTITSYMLMLWEVQYSPAKYVQFGGFLVSPVLGLGAVPTLRFCGNLNRHVALGAGVFGGGVSNVASVPLLAPLWLAGGHAEVTISRDDSFIFNFGAIASWVNVDSKYNYLHNQVVLLPHIGGMTVLSKSWSLYMEISMPCLLLTEDTAAHNAFVQDTEIDLSLLERFLPHSFGDLVLVTYGFRWTWGRAFGDIGFFLPVNRDLLGLLKYMPPGLPHVGVGFRI